MKILIYNWNFITKFDLYNTFKKYNIQYDLFNSEFSPRIEREKEGFREALEKKVKSNNYDVIFSINYIPDISIIANEKNILYISWTYDSPNTSPLEPTLQNSINRVFIFDSDEYQKLKEAGIKNIYYLPLAVNVERLSQIRVSPILRIKYDADVSFIGQMYQSDMDKIYPLLDEYGAGYVAAIINAQLNENKNRFVDELINENVMKRIFNEEVISALEKNLTTGFYQEVKSIQVPQIISFLVKAVTNKERMLILSLLAKYLHVSYYGPDGNILKGVNNQGIVDYNFIAPMVFKSSKINLNVTLRNIKSGIPQRILDIIGCNSLVLTNYQKDLDEYFKDGENILIYNSTEEALDKSRYYVKNYSVAKKIREKSFETVMKHFTYDERLKKIWEICDLKLE